MRILLEMELQWKKWLSRSTKPGQAWSLLRKNWKVWPHWTRYLIHLNCDGQATNFWWSRPLWPPCNSDSLGGRSSAVTLLSAANWCSSTIFRTVDIMAKYYLIMNKEHWSWRSAYPLPTHIRADELDRCKLTSKLKRKGREIRIRNLWVEERNHFLPSVCFYHCGNRLAAPSDALVSHSCESCLYLIWTHWQMSLMCSWMRWTVV